MVVDIRDIITCFKFGDDRFRGLASAEGQILPFPIDFDGRPYNTLTLTLPCERVIFWKTYMLQNKIDFHRLFPVDLKNVCTVKKLPLVVQGTQRSFCHSSRFLLVTSGTRRKLYCKIYYL